jgi:hypothetical protein
VATAAELGARPGGSTTWSPTTSGSGDCSSGPPARPLTAGELAPGTDPAQLAFELSAILAGANIVAVLHDDDSRHRPMPAAPSPRGWVPELSGVSSVANWS